MARQKNAAEGFRTSAATSNNCELHNSTSNPFDQSSIRCHCGGAAVITDASPPHWKRANCSRCGKWLKWLAKPRPDWRVEPITERQAAFLRRRGLPAQATMGSASAAIRAAIEWEAS
jgi:hypothetical protein